MRNRIIGIMKISTPSALLLFFMAGCISPPVLLRNRPNVPPPVVDSYLENQPLSTPVSAPVVSPVVDEQTPIVVNLPEALPPPDIKTAPLTYTVVKGDSCWKIARMYGVTKEELATCNNLSLKKPLKVGTVLLIPPGGEFITPEKRSKLKPAPRRTTRQVKKTSYTPSDSDGTYTVRKGDSLWKIARRYNVSTSQLVKANHIDARRPIKPGDKLIIPGAAGKIKAEPVSTPISNVHKSTTQPTPKQIEQPVIKKVRDPLDDILNDSPNSETDDVLDEAMGRNSKPAPAAPLKTAPIKVNTQMVANTKPEPPKMPPPPKSVVDELDKAVSVSNADVPGSLYIEEVLPNETLQEIADRHGCTVEEILAVNPGLSANKELKPFTSIKIPNK